MLERIFEPDRASSMSMVETLQLCTLQQLMKYRNVRWTACATHMVQIRNAYKILVGKFGEPESLEDRSRREVSINKTVNVRIT